MVVELFGLLHVRHSPNVLLPPKITVRALARMGLAPVEVLTRVNAALLDRGAREDRFCTAVFAEISTRADKCVLRLANGGHPLPLIRRSSGSSTAVEVHGQLLGVFETVSMREATIDLAPEDMIVFYTDGITEARAGGEQFGEDRLMSILDEVDGLSAGEIAGSVAQAAQRFADALSDDIVVLVVQGMNRQHSSRGTARENLVAGTNLLHQ